MNPKISVVIPCYKTGKRVKILIEEISLALETYADGQFEIVMVVDGSPDETWSLVSEAARKMSFVRGVNLMRNYGQHSALLAGVRASRGEIIVTIDDDLQHSPKEIPILISALSENVDIVYGISVDDEHSLIRNFASNSYKKFASALLRAEGAKIAGAFRAFKREIIPRYDGHDDLYAPLDVMLSWYSSKAIGVPVNMEKRMDGNSNYTIRGLIRHASNAITGYSIAPLRLVSYLGLLTFVTSFVIFIVTVSKYFLGTITVAGFPTLAVMISMFAGVQLLSLGIIGEYLGRLHMRSMGRPRYVIRDEI
jgi:undecaprenyl-phosphate 4-deoxy-4-formamido-L-arabinose transferase